MYRSALTAFEQMDSELLAVAQTLGFSESRYFRKIALPLSMNGLLAGGVLAFARGLGEFGATTMLAGIFWQNKNASFSYLLCCSKWGLALSQSICCNYVITLPDYFIFTEFFSQRAWRRSE